jgi:hypothetical protein
VVAEVELAGRAVTALSRTVGVVSSRRSKNKKAWARQRKKASRSREVESDGVRPAPVRLRSTADSADLLSRVEPQPSELDQISVLIVEEQLGLPVTDLDGIQKIVATLPFEPCMSLLAILAGRVEAALNDGRGQVDLAREFFGGGPLVERYAKIMASDDRSVIFGPQSLYTLMRVLIDEAYDAPIRQQLTDEERGQFFRAVVASNSVIERGIDMSVGPTTEDLLAFELQAGAYYARPQWMEEMARHWELYELMATDPDLAKSEDFVPVTEWLARSGVTAVEQWQIGWGLSAGTNAWDATQHPHVPPPTVAEILRRGGFAGREAQALAVVSADRSEFRAAFIELAAENERYAWELRPLKTWPFLRLQGDGGLLLLGRPWLLSWLGEGFHYRAMRVAQQEDAAKANGRDDHVQRYTAFAGQTFETYCLRLAEKYVPEPAIVLGEQSYGKGGGNKTSDVAVCVGEDLILFEVNARRVSAVPLVTGDPLDATLELTRLLVKKVNQLGVSIGALLNGKATLPGIDLAGIKRIFPVVVAAGNLWHTSHLWKYIDEARDESKCASFADERVQPLQVADAAAYEMLIGLARDGHGLPEIFEHKTDSPWLHRDWAVWLKEDRRSPGQPDRLPSIVATFETLTAAAQQKWFPHGQPADETASAYPATDE